MLLRKTQEWVVLTLSSREVNVKIGHSNLAGIVPFDRFLKPESLLVDKFEACLPFYRFGGIFIVL